MFPIESVNTVRALYVAELIRMCSQHPENHLEPALREESGELAVDGVLALPCRVDLIPLDGELADEMLTIDSPGKVNFPVVSFQMSGTAVTVAPFVWDYASITIGHSPAPPEWSPLHAWFMKWFDPEDDNPANDEGLYGVVHFLSDPEAVDGGSSIDVDFGSAPVEALQDLLDTLARMNVTHISVT